MKRQIITALIAILVLCLGLTFLSIVCRAGNLNGQAGYEAALLNLLHASSGHDDWTQAKIREFINEGITFVEGVSKENEVHDTVTFAPGTSPIDSAFLYTVSSDIASGGILNVFYMNTYVDELIALSRRNPEDFGKDDIGSGESGATFTYMFGDFDDTLMVYPKPDQPYVMHIVGYKVSDWMTGAGADTVVTLPLFHRLLALEMAYGYAMLSTGTAEGFGKFQAIRQGVLEAIYGLPPEPEKQVQSLGIEGQ